MKYGVIIESGASDWQIFQQVNGFAAVTLGGTYHFSDRADEDIIVNTRVVKEDTTETVVAWTAAKKLGDCRWEAEIAMPVGGLYRIETSITFVGQKEIEWGVRGDMVLHIGAGDLYVIAGQSNSAGYGKDPIYDPAETGVHLYRNCGKWDMAAHPLNESTNSIHIENREGGNPGHSPYLAFAKMLKRALGYPIGLIQSALGGSPLSAWNPQEDGTLYRPMLASVKATGGKIKGVLWYQGCSDTNPELSATYLERFEQFVSALRRDINDDSLPFYTVQINRVIGNADDTTKRCWNIIREVQRQAARTIDNVFVVPTIDLTLYDGIHISSACNMVLGERLARMALYCTKAPEIASAKKLSDNQLQLAFDNIKQRIYTYDMPACELPFTINDDSGKVDIESYTTEINTITITTARKLEGAITIHCGDGTHPNVFFPKDNDGNLPILPFYNFSAE